MYAKHIHYFGAFIHFIYLGLFAIYVNLIYLDRDFEARVPLCWCMLICLVYPTFYDGLQLWNAGMTYFEDPWNFLDQGYIWFGVANILQ